MTQTEQVKAHLVKHNSITALEAFKRYQIMRLAARIRDLKNEGYPTVSTMVDKNGKRYAKYIRAWA